MLKKMLMICGIIAMSAILHSCNKEDNCADCPITTKYINVGVLLGFTGTGSQNAIETQSALNLCLQDLKSYIKRNGSDASINLLYEDTQSDTNVAKTKAQSLIDRGVHIIIGPYTSAEAKAVKALADVQNVLLISHSAVSTSLAIPNDNLLRFAPSDSYQADAINAMFVYDSIKAIIPIVRNDLWSKSLVAATVNKFAINGGVTVSSQSFEPGATDFTTVIAGIKEGITRGSSLYGIDKIAIYLISYSDGTDLLAAMADAGVTNEVKIYGASAFAQSASLPANSKAAEFAYKSQLQCPVFGFDEGASNIYQPIQERIQSDIGRYASIYALAAYDILWTTAMAKLTQKNDAGFASFKSHFVETAGGYYGATGRTYLDENGDRRHVYYDFWTIGDEAENYAWRLSAKYNTTDHSLIKYFIK